MDYISSANDLFQQEMAVFKNFDNILTPTRRYVLSIYYKQQNNI